MYMTYGDLLTAITNLPLDRMEDTATIFVPGIDEYYPIAIAFTDEDCDVLDPGHMVLTIDEGY